MASEGEMTIFGMLRIKNEARWIEDVIFSIRGLCERIFVLDDHSTDGTPEICERFEGVTVFRSQFEGLDETRDKSFLLQRIMANVSDSYLGGNQNSPYWVLAIDGDELLENGAEDTVYSTLLHTSAHAFKLPIKYLWNSRQQIRVDGVYENFARPSLFRLFNRAFTFQSTPWGGNMHCSSIPQQLLHHAHEICPARLWHLGYMEREDRIRKWQWYNSVDPNNEAEDCYRHCVQGDIDAVPAGATLKHAGPLRLVSSGL
jgi:glycosyltransferase involved in cell wall biosynthesis